MFAIARRCLVVLVVVASLGVAVLAVSTGPTAARPVPASSGPTPSPSPGPSPTPPHARHKHYARVNNDPGFLEVYDNNVENLETVHERAPTYCRGDWKDLVYYMKVQHRSPDLFLVEQISDRAQLDHLIATLNRKLAGRYAGVIAQRHPRPQNHRCGPSKLRQTNAIVYRTGRFSYVRGSKVTWRADHRSGGHCHNDTRDRSVGVAVRLHDKIAHKTIVAGTFHWPTKNRHGPACAAENAREAAQHMGQGNAALRILGGDANATTTSAGGRWSALINGERGGALGYRDVVYATCMGHGDCIARQWTIGHKRRIDFLFTRKSGGGYPGISGEATVSFNAGDRADRQVTGHDRADRDYSDHRAIKARIHY